MRNRQLFNQECVIECISGNLVSQLRIPICPLPVLYRIYSILNGKEIIYRSLKLKKKNIYTWKTILCGRRRKSWDILNDLVDKKLTWIFF